MLQQSQAASDEQLATSSKIQFKLLPRATTTQASTITYDATSKELPPLNKI